MEEKGKILKKLDLNRAQVRQRLVADKGIPRLPRQRSARNLRKSLCVLPMVWLTKMQLRFEKNDKHKKARVIF